MKPFAFKLNTKDNRNAIVLFDINKPNSKKTYIDKAPIGIAEKNILINIMNTGLLLEDITDEHLSAMVLMYHNYFDKPASTSLPIMYQGFAMSIAKPNTNVIALQGIDRLSYSPIYEEIFTNVDKESAVKHLRNFVDNYDLGGSTYGGAVVFRNGYIIGDLSYNGRIFNTVGYGGRSHHAIEDFLSEPNISLTEHYGS